MAFYDAAIGGEVPSGIRIGLRALAEAHGLVRRTDVCTPSSQVGNMRAVNVHGNVPDARSEERTPLELAVYVDVLLRFRWTFLAVAATFLSVGMVYALLAKPMYRTDITVHVEEADGDNRAGKLETSISPVLNAKSDTSAEIELLRSRAVVGKAVDRLHLDIELTARYFPLIGQAIAGLRSGLSTPGLLGWGGFAWGRESASVADVDIPRQMEGTRIYLTALGDNRYQVRFDNDEATATGVVGAPLTIVTGRGRVSLLVTQLAGHAGARFVMRRVPRATAISRLQEQLLIFERGKESGVIGVSLEGDSPTMIASILNEIARGYMDQDVRRKAAEAEKSLAFLEQQLPQFRQQVQADESRYNAMRGQHGTVDLHEEARQMLAQSVKIQTRLRELHQQRQELVLRFTAAHPAVQTIDAQIAGLGAELEDATAKLRTMPDVEQDVQHVKRDVKGSTEMLQSMLNDIQELRLIRASEIGTARLIDPAEIPVKPESPNRRLLVSLSVLLGVFAGLLAIAVRHSLEGGFAEADDVEQQAGMTVCSAIPFSASRAPLLPGDPAMESMRTFHTTLQFMLSGCRNRVVVISSPAPGAGKSFISAHLAAIAASGCRVVLIDADLRRGGLHHHFGVPHGPGLTDVLLGQPLDHALRRQVAAGLDFIPTGTKAPHAADVLASPGADALLDELGSRYDLILIDTPPVLAVADAAILAGKADLVFLVARAQTTTASELRASQRAMRQAGAEVSGVLFNGLNIEGRWYRSHQQYGKYRYLSR